MKALIARIRCVWTMGRGVALGLPEAAAGRDPIDLFGEWYAAAEDAGLFLPESVCLATTSKDGQPSARMVLLKGRDAEGFRFFTNYDSRKARELEANPHAALCFHWPILERQVRVEGSVERVSEEVSYAYFKSRRRGSRIGAWASAQSDTLRDRADLKQRVKEMEARFEGQEEVPLPPNWGGYLLRPQRIEFWQGRANRLHDRLLFEREGDAWKTRWLYP